MYSLKMSTKWKLQNWDNELHDEDDDYPEPELDEWDIEEENIIQTEEINQFFVKMEALKFQ
jgi:hypothetical protein